MLLHFVSLNNVWIDEIHRLFPDAKATCGDVQTIPHEKTAFVSPANCLGFMDGGIDSVYSRTMFPGCEQQVKQKIRDLGHTTLLGRPYLPIGSAFVVPVGETTGLICAPTMFLPHDVSKTRNAYLSCLAALLVFQKVGLYETLVLTSHCCGYGKMSEQESARQMRKAYDDFRKGHYPVDSCPGPSVVLLPLCNEEQPDNFDNREIKDIPIERLFLK
jgi:O-acetyl-ADP-ribose deacetylase (regulator of RNase III)